MTSWRRALGLLGVVTWLPPFVVAFLAFPFRESARPLFESIMAVAVPSTAVFLWLSDGQWRQRRKRDGDASPNIITPPSRTMGCLVLRQARCSGIPWCCAAVAGDNGPSVAQPLALRSRPAGDKGHAGRRHLRREVFPPPSPRRWRRRPAGVNAMMIVSPTKIDLE